MLCAKQMVNMSDDARGPYASEQPIRTNSNPAKERVGWDRIIELIFAFAIVVATIGNVWVTHKQWTAMKESNQIQTRPYVKITLKPESFVLRSPDDKRGDSRTLKFQLTNVGKLPRLVLALSAVDWDGPGHARSANWPSVAQSGREFLFPDEKGVEFSSQGMSITAGQISDLKEGGGGRLFVMVDSLYGPLDSSANPSNDFETHICTSFALVHRGDEFQLGESRPCNEADSNYAK